MDVRSRILATAAWLAALAGAAAAQPAPEASYFFAPAPSSGGPAPPLIWRASNDRTEPLPHPPLSQIEPAPMPQPNDVLWSQADWAWMAGLLDVLMPGWFHGCTVVATAPEPDCKNPISEEPLGCANAANANASEEEMLSTVHTNTSVAVYSANLYDAEPSHTFASPRESRMTGLVLNVAPLASV